MNDITETTPSGGTYEAPRVTRESLDGGGNYVSAGAAQAPQALANAESNADGSVVPFGDGSDME